MYAARAKTIRNTSSVNVDRGTDGPGGGTDSESLRVVSLELDGLRQRFLSREREFDALCATSASSASENARLKGELQRLEAQNASERKELEQKMGTVIHSKSSLLATQNEKFGKLQIRLQERVTTYQKTCEQQEKEITRLRDERSLLERKMSDVGATRTEVKDREGTGGFNVTSTCECSDETCQRKCPLFENSTRDDLSFQDMSGNSE